MVSKLTTYHIRRIALRQGYYERKFCRKVGHPPDYDNPRTFTEKLAWMRLHDRNPLYPTLVDKIAVRDYVRERVGEDILVPCYGVWDRPEDIDFDSLPKSFVLKCNHESGFVIICKDKDELDRTYVRAQLATRLKMNFYYRFHEWPYKHVKPRILAEELLVDENGAEPHDYKTHCFGGQPGYTAVFIGRHTAPKRGYYSPDWERMPFTGTTDPLRDVPRPPQLERMQEIIRALAEGLRYCRVDLYVLTDRIYFGEITLFPGAGLLKYDPSSYDLYWGERVQLTTEGQVVA